MSKAPVDSDADRRDAVVRRVKVSRPAQPRRHRDAIADGTDVAVVVGDVNLFRAVVAARLVPFVVSTRDGDVLWQSRHFADGAVLADPVEDEEAFVAGLVEIGRSFRNRPLLFTTNDGVLLLMSQHRERLQSWFLYELPPHGLVVALVDKSGFAELARRHRLPVPATVRAAELEASLAPLRDIAGPYVIKPDSRHYGWHRSDLVQRLRRGPLKVLHVDSVDELERLLPEVRSVTRDFVVQQCIPGEDRQIFSLHAYFDRQSRPLASFVGRKIRSYPRDSGISTCLELIKDERVVRAGMAILDALRFVGPVKLDFKEDPRDGRLYLLEVNARSTLWFHLGAANGLNLARVACDDLHGRAVTPRHDYGTRVCWLSLGNDLRSFLRGAHGGPGITVWAYVRSLLRPKVYDIFAWSDPLPLLAHLRNRLRRRARDRAARRAG